MFGDEIIKSGIVYQNTRCFCRAGKQDFVPVFAKLFGFDSFIMETRAVGYIGFSGSLGPLDADQPADEGAA